MSFKWFRTTSTTEGLGEEVEHINTCTAYVMHIWDSSRPEKKLLWKIPLTFLFDRLHFTFFIFFFFAGALFHCGHLVNRQFHRRQVVAFA